MVPLNLPSQPMLLSFVSKTFCPHLFQIINFILVIPKPFTKILLFMVPLSGVNAFGTSTAGITIALTGLHAVSGHPATLKATRHALKVPVALY